MPGNIMELSEQLEVDLSDSFYLTIIILCNVSAKVHDRSTF